VSLESTVLVAPHPPGPSLAATTSDVGPVGLTLIVSVVVVM
jgi:hypothetical protein